jgi:hypothetical protein
MIAGHCRSENSHDKDIIHSVSELTPRPRLLEAPHLGFERHAALASLAERGPEVIATRPTQSADGAVDLTVDAATVLGMELCLPGSGGDATSRDAMSSLQEAGGNAHWLLSQCLRCIADESAQPHRIREPLGAGDTNVCRAGEWLRRCTGVV